mmetsp:Transcript_30856/g.37399  ORF Transcript_30856/g.37399 Transcript_30856/m.37399 type:complete len:93 (+) Transcript_30856:145-423(+)|eukprot:CAMPEP_0197845140 /NCGR_PEP_ID=MMETSP1438-20131217/2089_1 /TAXON_ID=1461541 /ORGANISM="Pterosperma sp., Strain CCMP1384" /LENGTH=92 /DNA_ID=CAMNT_0043456275 /DNA_START=145 /DNA_END=423 /DNA_ORIENTATION=+
MEEKPREDEMFPDRANTHRNPLVLVGAIATAGVLAAGLVAFRNGNTDLSQKMMRTRVLFQGATVAVMVGTSGSLLIDNSNEAAPAPKPAPKP